MCKLLARAWLCEDKGAGDGFYFDYVQFRSVFLTNCVFHFKICDMLCGNHQV